jgi:uncharacterized membrane protein
MKSILSFASKTIKGGVFFLLPILLILFFLKKAVELIRPMAELISNELGIHSSILNVPYLITFLIILLLCFFAGWIASQGFGNVMIGWIEENLLSLFPGYQLMKTSMQSKAGLLVEHEFPVVMVPVDGMVFAFLVDEFENGDCVVFVPSAPNTWEGNVIIFKKELVQRTNYKQGDISAIMRKLGVGMVSQLNKSKANLSEVKGKI